MEHETVTHMRAPARHPRQRLPVSGALITAVLSMCIGAAPSSSSPSSLPSPASQLAGADDALQSGDPDGALVILERLTASGPFTHAELVQHRRLLATARAFVDDADGAVAAFGALLQIEPDFTIPYTASPRVTFAFEAARAAQKKKRPLAVDIIAPAVARLGEPILIRLARRADPDGVIVSARLEVTDGSSGEVTTHNVDFVAAPAAIATITLAARSADNAAADDDGRPGVMLHLQVTGRDVFGSDVIVGRPIDVPVGFDAPPPWWQSPALVAAGVVVGVVVAGVTATAIIVASLPPDDVGLSVTVQR